MILIALLGCTSSRYACENSNVNCNGAGTAESAFDDSHSSPDPDSDPGNAPSESSFPQAGYWEISVTSVTQNECRIDESEPVLASSYSVLLPTEDGFVLGPGQDGPECHYVDSGFECVQEQREIAIDDATSLYLEIEMAGYFQSPTQGTIASTIDISCVGDPELCAAGAQMLGASALPCSVSQVATMIFLSDEAENEGWD